MRYRIERVFAENAPRQTAWAVIEDCPGGEAVDYRDTRAEARGVVNRLTNLEKASMNETPLYDTCDRCSEPGEIGDDGLCSGCRDDADVVPTEPVGTPLPAPTPRWTYLVWQDPKGVRVTVHHSEESPQKILRQETFKDAVAMALALPRVKFLPPTEQQQRDNEGLILIATQSYLDTNIQPPAEPVDPEDAERRGPTAIRLQVEVEIQRDWLDDTLVTAFEGGINYWCNAVTIVTPPADGDWNGYASSAVSRGGVLHLHVDEEDEPVVLDLTALSMGVQMYQEKRGFRLGSKHQDFAEDNILDAGEADLLVQYAVFEEERYG